MKVLVDTSIWSMALRRSGTLSKEDQYLVRELSDLLNDVKVAMIGPIRQELLSGISSPVQYNALKEKAAEFYNICRSAGVQGSHIDFLICSTAADAGMQIFSTDKDFMLYSKHLPITLYQPVRGEAFSIA